MSNEAQKALNDAWDAPRDELKLNNKVLWVHADIANGLLDALKDCAKALSRAEKELHKQIESRTLDKAYAAITKAEGVLDD